VHERSRPHPKTHPLCAHSLGGALADPVDTGLLVFTDKGVAESFAQQDPYVANGLVTKWSVRQWTVVAGSKL
jgi:hypothetical protein